jgi:hypothetical protein
LASRHTIADEQYGSATIAYNNGDEAHLGSTGAVGGWIHVAANSHTDHWYRGNSLCLPVPKEADSRYSTALKSQGSPATWFTFVPTRLTYGPWETVPIGKEERQAPRDGFLFVSIEAAGLQQGVVHCLVNGSPLAAASAEVGGMPAQTFCLPILKQERYQLVIDQIEPISGVPKLSAWLLPTTNEAWRLQRHDEMDLNMDHQDKHDGILHGFVTAQDHGVRADLTLYGTADAMDADSVKDVPDATAVPLYACASMHREPPSRRAIASSAMLPVPKDWHHMAALWNTSGAATARLFWTTIVPA